MKGSSCLRFNNQLARTLSLCYALQYGIPGGLLVARVILQVPVDANAFAAPHQVMQRHGSSAHMMSATRDLQVRLDETCREFRDAARVMGNTALFQQMEAAAAAIKRDVIFAASLYVA